METFGVRVLIASKGTGTCKACDERKFDVLGCVSVWMFSTQECMKALETLRDLLGRVESVQGLGIWSSSIAPLPSVSDDVLKNRCSRICLSV